MDNTLAKSLYRWAYNKPANRAKIEDWLDKAVIDLANDKGEKLANSSANGVSVAFQSTSLSTAEWFSTLSQVITYLDTRPVTRIRGRVS